MTDAAAWAEAVAVAAFSSLLLTAVSLRVFPALGWTSVNWRGRRLPLGAGAAAVAGGALGAAVLAASVPEPPAAWIWAPLLTMLLGWIDDRRGSHAVRGFSAHVRALLRGRVTTGALKLLGGGLVALTATAPEGLLSTGVGLPVQAFARWLASALVVALSANAVNSFDLRPGRAAKAWLLLVAAALLLGARAPWAVPYGAALVAYAPWDLRGRAMMGDAGANGLGAVLGLALVAIPWPGAVWVAAAVLAWFHLWMERHSLTAWITERPALDWLDRLGRSGP